LRKTLHICAPALMAAVFACAASSQGRIAELRSRFVTESDAVHKAKLMPQLGDAEFQEIHKDMADGRIAEALAVLRQYLAEAQSCEKGLDATGIDAEKHPSGFKQLQISLQESLRRLEGVVPQLTSEEQGPFLEVRKDISQTNVHLIHQLFPHEPPAESGQPHDER
jgi:hypothetical protein